MPNFLKFDLVRRLTPSSFRDKNYRSIITLTSPTNPSSLPFALPSPHGPRSASDPSAFPLHSAPSSYSSLPPPPPPTPLPTPGTSPRARALRRAARSALVDTYSRFVLPELVRWFNRVGCAIRVVGNEIEISNDNVHAFGYQHAYQNQDTGGFCVWILHSMRRRALERMEQILEESGVNAECLTAQRPPWSVVEEPSRICDSGANPEMQDAGFEATTMAVPLSFSDDEDEKSEVDTDAKASSDNADADSDVSETETLDTDTDGSSVHTPSTMSHAQCYPRPNTRTSMASSSSSDSASSTSSASSEAWPVTPTDVLPPAPTKALPSLPAEAQLQEPLHDQPPPLVPHHRRLSLPEHPHPHLPQAQNSSQYPTSHLSSVALSEYTQLQDLRTRLGQLVLFAASQARVSADEIKSRLEVLAVRSRRRAWSNKALSPTARSVMARANGSTTLGLATPFRGSSLARYVWTPEDFIREAASGSTSKAASYGSLSAVYGALAKASFPSSRPRLRPRIDYEAALAAAVVEQPSGHTDDEDDGDDKLVEREFELYEEFPGPSPIDGRARRHHRRRDVGMTSMRGRGGATGVGRLFPVSEEMEGEDSQEFVMSLSVQSRGRPRRTLAERTFMGCDEVRVEGYDEDDEFGDLGDYLEHADFEVDDGLEDQRELDLELGMGFGVSDIEPHSADIEGLDTNMDRLEMGFVERPKIRPRVRTSSMMGVFVQKARGVQRSLQGGGHRLKMPQTPQLQPRQLPQPLPEQPQERNHYQKNANGLTADSLLWQPMTAVPQDAQHQPRLKSTKAVAAPLLHGNAPLPSPAPISPVNARKAMDVPRLPTPAPIYTQVEIDMITDDSMQISISGMEEFDIKGAALPLPLPNASRIALGLPKIPLGAGPQVDYGLGADTQAQEEFTLAMDLPRRVSAGRKRVAREGGRDVHYDYQTRRRSSFENGSGLRPKLGGIFEESQIPHIQV